MHFKNQNLGQILRVDKTCFLRPGHKCTHDSNTMNEDLTISTISDVIYLIKRLGIVCWLLIMITFVPTYCGAKSDKGIAEYLTACYYTYNESSSGYFIAEVALFHQIITANRYVNNTCVIIKLLIIL